MALTITLLGDGNDTWGRTGVNIYKAVPAASDYPTGGYQVGTVNTSGGITFISGLGLRIITDIWAHLDGAGTAFTSAPVLNYDRTLGTLQAFESAAVASTPAAAISAADRQRPH